MKFFDKQKIDEAGRTGVRLQKILIFFATLVIICGLFGLPFSIISASIALGVLSFGFFGAYYRKPCCLKIYAVIRILELIFHFLVLTVAVTLFITLIGLIAVGATTPAYVNDYLPTYAQPMPMPVQSTPMQPAPDAPHSMPMQPAPTTTTSGMMMQMSNKMMSMHSKMMSYVQPEPEVPIDNTDLGNDVIIDYAPDYFVGYVYYLYNEDLTVTDIVIITAIITAAVVIGIVGSLVYYGLVIYTIVLSFRMARQIKQSAVVHCIQDNSVSEKVLPTTDVAPQPFVYVVTEHGSQPVLLQPVDPSLYPMQTFA